MAFQERPVRLAPREHQNQECTRPCGFSSVSCPGLVPPLQWAFTPPRGFCALCCGAKGVASIFHARGWGPTFLQNKERGTLESQPGTLCFLGGTCAMGLPYPVQNVVGRVWGGWAGGGSVDLGAYQLALYLCRRVFTLFP